MNRRLFLLGASALGLGACKRDYRRATLDEVRAAYYFTGKPPTIALLSMINERKNTSEHAGLLINGSQRVLYDPAGGFKARNVPRRGDINYGVSDAVLLAYSDFHYSFGNVIHVHELDVPLSSADTAIRSAETTGEARMLQCATHISTTLERVPGFEDVPFALSPDKLMRYFAARPGVRYRILDRNPITG